jgi:hypothetical protein
VIAADTTRVPLVEITPSSLFEFGRLKLHRKTGTATLSIAVPGPGTISMAGKQVVPRGISGVPRVARELTRSVTAAGTVRLLIKGKRKVRNKLRRVGKATVSARVTFSPSGGLPATQVKKFKLRKS